MLPGPHRFFPTSVFPTICRTPPSSSHTCPMHPCTSSITQPHTRSIPVLSIYTATHADPFLYLITATYADACGMCGMPVSYSLNTPYVLLRSCFNPSTPFVGTGNHSLWFAGNCRVREAPPKNSQDQLEERTRRDSTYQPAGLLSSTCRHRHGPGTPGRDVDTKDCNFRPAQRIRCETSWKGAKKKRVRRGGM
jgi:hypothetical protein